MVKCCECSQYNIVILRSFDRLFFAHCLGKKKKKKPEISFFSSFSLKRSPKIRTPPTGFLPNNTGTVILCVYRVWRRLAITGPKGAACTHTHTLVVYTTKTVAAGGWGGRRGRAEADGDVCFCRDARTNNARSQRRRHRRWVTRTAEYDAGERSAGALMPRDWRQRHRRRRSRRRQVATRTRRAEW